MAEYVQAISDLLEREVQHQHDTSPTVLVKPVWTLSSDGIYLGRLPTSSFSYRFLKRFLDIAVSGVLLLLFAPFFLLIALAVRASSPGPVFYRERRVGRFGKHFTIYKFRSMFTREHLQRVSKYRDDEETQMRLRVGKRPAGDPRVTRVGALLRKLSFDELPQLINILKGDMSLVGPRPVIDAELSHYGRHVFFYKLMYPGLSGLWQVSGRSDLSYQTRVSMDVAYCKKWNPLLDIVILARTVPAVVRGTGAY
jgi:exopolysaccharide production protein ExoY